MPRPARRVRVGSAPDTVLGTGIQTARAVIDAGRDRPADRGDGDDGDARPRVLASEPGLLLPAGRRAAARHGPVLRLGPDPAARPGAIGGRVGEPAAVGARRSAPGAREGERIPVRGADARHRRARTPQRRALDHHDELRRRRDDRRAHRGARRARVAGRARPQHVRGRRAAAASGPRASGRTSPSRRGTSTPLAVPDCSTSSPPVATTAPDGRADRWRCTALDAMTALLESAETGTAHRADDDGRATRGGAAHPDGGVEGRHDRLVAGPTRTPGSIAGAIA